MYTFATVPVMKAQSFGYCFSVPPSGSGSFNLYSQKHTYINIPLHKQCINIMTGIRNTKLDMKMNVDTFLKHTRTHTVT